MRSLLAFFALAFSAGVSALVSPAGEPACIAEYCAGNFPDAVQPPAPTRSISSPLDALTNAERLVRGMPLKAPVRRKSDFVRRSTPSSVPVIQAVKTVTKRGVIEVKNNTGDCLGYISKNSLSKAQLQYESAIENATTVTFPIQESSISASQVRITMEDSDEIGFPLLGLVQGANDTSVDIGLESYNFLYLMGIAQPGSVAGAVPANISNAYTNVTTLVRAAESDVWTIDLTTGNLFPQWINSNGSAPTTVLFAQSSALYAGGNSSGFSTQFPSPITEYTLQFVETK